MREEFRDAKRIAPCVQAALRHVEADTSLRVPRSEAARANALAEWLRSQQVRYEPQLRELVRQQFPYLPADDVVEQVLWPRVEHFLRTYAIRGLAAAWASRQFGDAITIGLPEPAPGGWRVPLGSANGADDLGQIVLDENGVVVPVSTSSRTELLEAIRGSASSPVEAAAWK